MQKSHPSELIALLTTLGLIAIIGSAVLATVTEDKWRDALWLEIAKSGVWVVAVGVVGGALGAIWQNIRDHREAQIAKEAKDRDRKLANKAKKRDRRRADLAKEREREIEAHAKLRAELVSLVQMYNSV